MLAGVCLISGHLSPLLPAAALVINISKLRAQTAATASRETHSGCLPAKKVSSCLRHNTQKDHTNWKRARSLLKTDTSAGVQNASVLQWVLLRDRVLENAGARTHTRSHCVKRSSSQTKGCVCTPKKTPLLSRSLQNQHNSAVPTRAKQKKA